MHIIIPKHQSVTAIHRDSIYAKTIIDLLPDKIRFSKKILSVYFVLKNNKVYNIGADYIDGKDIINTVGGYADNLYWFVIRFIDN